MHRVLFPLFLLAACEEPRPEETGIEDTSVSNECSPALTLHAEYPAVLAQHPLKFTASGGTGSYVFSLQNEASTSILNATTGAFLASEDVGTQEIIEVTDQGCEGSVTRTLDIVDFMRVLPEQLTIKPEMSFSPSIASGSGEYQCELILNPSGSTLADCLYTAGNNVGADLIRVQDVQTGYFVDVPINVNADTGLDDVVSLVLLPLGATYTPEASGGSGQFEYTVLSGDITLIDGVLTSKVPGTAVVKIQDRFVPSFQTVLTIVTTEALSPDLPPDGESVHFAEAMGAGDLDGDGNNEAILSVYSASYNAYYGGLISVYTGDSSGIDPIPTQTFGSTDTLSQFGRTMAVGDFDGDGNNDLALGAPQGPNNTADGYVSVHLGLGDGTFNEETPQILNVDYVDDRLGSALASCDLNNDGFDDLIAGARTAEDRSTSSIQYTQGGLYIYWGSSIGLPDEADDYAWGPYRDYHLGTSMVSGDFNGDGWCDIAAGTYYFNGSETGDKGGVSLFFNDGTGLIDTSPTLQFEGPGRIGYKLSAADIDDDGSDDLALSADDAPNAEGATHRGAVAVYFGATLSSFAPGTVLRLNDADWLQYGTSSYQYYGRELDFGDANNDGYIDLMVAGTGGEVPGSSTNAGILNLYLGDGGGLENTASQIWTLAESYAYLGVGLAFIGDMNEDGYGEWLAHSDRSITFGSDAGAPFVVSIADANPIPLAYDHKSAGHEFGRPHTFTVMDINNDATQDLVFSGAGAGRNNENNAGLFFTTPLDSADLSTTLTELSLYDREWNGGSRKGTLAKNVGDFTGNGYSDLLLLSRDDNQPYPLDSGVYATPVPCNVKVNGGGLATLYEGSETGLSYSPTFSYFGPYSYDDLRHAIGELDVDGDGANDLVVSSDIWQSSRGGLAVLRGRTPTEAKTEVICNALEIQGPTTNDRFGYSLANLGDLDGDGCAEFAASAPFDSTQGGDGSVSIIWGWNESSGCHRTQPEVTTLKTRTEDSAYGATLESFDINEDGYKELFIGTPSSGSVAIVDGEQIASLSSGPLDGIFIKEDDQGHTYIAESLPNTQTLTGSTGFGAGFTAIAHPTEPGVLAAIGSDAGAGGATVYHFNSMHPSGTPIAIVGGETHSTGGNLGQGLLLHHGPEGLFLFTGAPNHDAADGVDQGGLYPFLLPLD